MCGIMMEGTKWFGEVQSFPLLKSHIKYIALLLLEKDDHKHCDAKSGNEQTNRNYTVMVAK